MQTAAAVCYAFAAAAATTAMCVQVYTNLTVTMYFLLLPLLLMPENEINLLTLTEDRATKQSNAWLVN